MIKLNSFRKIAIKSTIRKKVLLYFFISTILVDMISLCTYNNTRILTRELHNIFTNDILLTDLSNQLDKVETDLTAYLTTSHSVDLLSYLRESNNFRELVNGLKTSLSDNESDLLLTDIKNMSLTYLKATDSAVSEKRGRNISGYTNKFNDATELYNYITDYINKLKILEFKKNNTYYLQMSNMLGLLQVLNVIVIIFAMIFNIVLIFWFMLVITEPIIRLSKAAGEIANGNYNIPEVDVKTNDEVKTLAVSFNKMAASIRRQLDEIREKAQIENRLKEQEFKMKSMLDEAELQSLQAQIDPHFMFNTLNACMQLAMFEGAERTQLFIENFSELLRYNIGKLSTPTTVSSEIDNVESYVYLLKERFGDKVEFVKEIAEDLPDVETPRMILQPIVENSFTHGIQESEKKGIIRLAASRRGDTLMVVIQDNGCGMSDQKIKDILDESNITTESENKTTESKNTGIGLKNVISRLMLYYHLNNTRDIIEIESEIGKGTTITLKFPIQSKENDVCINS